MPTSMTQAFTLTLVGMGMTFAAIGLLVLGMYVMTALIKDTRPVTRKAVVIKVEKNLQSEATARKITAAVFPGITITPTAEPRKSSREEEGSQNREDRYRAAAAAVAIALAAQATAVPTVGVTATDGWNTFVRGQRLAQRQRYHTHRLH